MIRVSHPTDRPNFTAVDVGNLEVWFSYSTPIAYRVPGSGLVIRENDWSNTTGKHLTYLDGGNAAAKKERISGAKFEAQLSAIVDRFAPVTP